MKFWTRWKIKRILRKVDACQSHDLIYPARNKLIKIGQPVVDYYDELSVFSGNFLTMYTGLSVFTLGLAVGKICPDKLEHLSKCWFIGSFREAAVELAGNSSIDVGRPILEYIILNDPNKYIRKYAKDVLKDLFDDLYLDIYSE